MPPALLRRPTALLLSTLLLLPLVLCCRLAVAQSVPFPVVYARAPRGGDTTAMRLPEVRTPINVEAGTDLVLRQPDGTTTVLVPGGPGAVVDPKVSFDGQWVYYAHFPNVVTRNMDLNYPQGVPGAGSDLYKLHVATGQIVQLTHGEWTPSTGTGLWSSDPQRPVPAGTNYVGYRPFNLAPCPLPDDKLMFVSSRDNYYPARSSTFPNLQLFVLDERTGIVDKVGYLNLGSALHPTVLMDGRVMWSSGEAQGLRDDRVWGLWASYPDGRQWEPLMSAFTKAAAFHGQTQLSDGRVAVIDYYNLNNWGFGTLLAFASRMPDRPMADRVTYFGDPHPAHESNPQVRYGFASNGPRTTRYSFSPLWIDSLTPFAHGIDQASDAVTGVRVGKVKDPSGAPNNAVLLVWSGGPVNALSRPVSVPRPDAGIYLLPGGVPAAMPDQLVLVVNDPAYNEQQPQALVPYQAIYGQPQPAARSWLPNIGWLSPHLPPGTPHALVGTSSFYKRNTAPYSPEVNFFTQGAEPAPFDNAAIHAVRLVLMEGVSFAPRGPNAGVTPSRLFVNPAEEKLRLLGEIPLRKYHPDGTPILDPEGNPDTSFLAKLVADTVFTFQTLDAEGCALNLSQTWHQLRPGELRNDCGGCHAHAQQGLDIARTVAGQPGYVPTDLTQVVPQDVDERAVLAVLATYTPKTPRQLLTDKDVLPFRDCTSPLLVQHPDMPAADKRVLAQWIALGATVNLHATHGYTLRETRPTLHVQVHTETVTPPPPPCPTGCVPETPVPQTQTTLLIGAASVYQTLDLATLQVTLDGTDVTAQLQGPQAQVWRLPLTSPGQGTVVARVCDQPQPATGRGNCTERRLAAQW